jgi:hypothetical protein
MTFFIGLRPKLMDDEHLRLDVGNRVVTDEDRIIASLFGIEILSLTNFQSRRPRRVLPRISSPW